MISQVIYRILARFTDEDGQALTEYGLILGLIAIVCLVALGAIGTAISGDLDFIATSLGAGGGS